MYFVFHPLIGLHLFIEATSNCNAAGLPCVFVLYALFAWGNVA